MKGKNILKKLGMEKEFEIWLKDIKKTSTEFKVGQRFIIKKGPFKNSKGKIGEIGSGLWLDIIEFETGKEWKHMYIDKPSVKEYMEML